MNTANLETNTQTIERLTRENEELQAKLDAAERARAEMRELLKEAEPPDVARLSKTGASYLTTACEKIKWINRVKDALSSDAGKDFVSKGQVKPIVDALRRCVKQCDYIPAHEGLAHAKTLGINS